MNRPRRLARLSSALLLLAGLSGGVLVSAPAASAVTYSTTAPMILQNVSPEDLLANTRGICNGQFKIVMRNVLGVTNTLRYLNAAQKCGVKAIVYFQSTISNGHVYPSRVAPLVRAVKNHPALYGYLTVKEPSWVGVSASEIRALYRAFHAADPSHPVVGLWGDIPHFGDTRNPYLSGMANIVLVDWYPVETARGGCSRSGTTYVSTGPKWLAKVWRVVQTKTPKTPVWVMVQTQRNLAPACHKKQRPTQAQLVRQVRDAFTYAHASAIAFHTFQNSSYTLDERRDPTMVSWMKQLSGQVTAGTFR